MQVRICDQAGVTNKIHEWAGIRLFHIFLGRASNCGSEYLDTISSMPRFSCKNRTLMLYWEVVNYPVDLYNMDEVIKTDADITYRTQHSLNKMPIVYTGLFRLKTADERAYTTDNH